MKLLGVTIDNKLQFDNHIENQLTIKRIKNQLKTKRIKSIDKFAYF